MSDILYLDSFTNQFFRADEQQVKDLEKRMNDILFEKISDGNEIITFDEVRNALSIAKNGQNENDITEPKERRQNVMLVETTAKDWTREQKRDIIDIFRSMLNQIDEHKSDVNQKSKDVAGEPEDKLLLQTLYIGEQSGLTTAYLDVYDVMEKLEKELYPDRY